MAPSGNLLIPDFENNRIVEVNVATPPSLTFPTATPINASDSTDDPLTVTVGNIGNATLSFPLPTAGQNPSVATNFTWDNASTCTQTDAGSSAAFTLAPSASCTIAVDFMPTSSGSIAGSVVLTDNNLNAAAPNYITQSIGLSGTGQATTTTTLSASSGTITPGQSVTLTAQVTSAAPGTPTGTVSFYEGTSLLSTVRLSSGTASYTIAALAPGNTYNFTATYSGDTNFSGSSSTSSATVIVAPLDFTMTVAGPSSATVIPGGSIAYQLAVTPHYGSYAGTMNFAVSGLPAGATATFSPSSIPANGGPQTVTVTIQRPRPRRWTAFRAAPASHRRLAPPLALALLGLIGLGGLRKRGRALKRFLCLVALLAGGAAATLSLSGCGSNAGFFAQAQQNYTVTMTATAGSVQHVSTVTLNVQ